MAETLIIDPLCDQAFKASVFIGRDENNVPLYVDPEDWGAVIARAVTEAGEIVEQFSNLDFEGYSTLEFEEEDGRNKIKATISRENLIKYQSQRIYLKVYRLEANGDETLVMGSKLNEKCVLFDTGEAESDSLPELGDENE